MDEARLSRVIRAPEQVIATVLMDASHLPDWNPAFVAVHAEGPVVAVGVPMQLEGIRGLHGILTYTVAERDRVEMTWKVRGLEEESGWLLRGVPGFPDRTDVTHWVRRSGALSVLLAHEFQGLPALRLERLARHPLVRSARTA